MVSAIQIVVPVLKGHDFRGCGKTPVLKGTGFSPYINFSQMNGASAPEGWFFSTFTVRSRFFRSLFSRAVNGPIEAGFSP